MKAKKSGSIIAILLLISAFLFAFSGCGDRPADMEGEASITLSAETLELDLLEKAVLVASASGTEGSVVWASSDPSVAEVNEGEVFALKAGNTTITASAGGVESSCAVTVYDSGEYPSITLDKSSVNVKQGNKVSVTAVMQYKGETLDAAFSYSSQDETVASFENGVITANGLGTTVVSVRGIYGTAGLTRDVVVTVTENVSFMLDKNFVQLATSEPSEEYKVSASVSAFVYEGDELVRSPQIEWTSDSSSVSVENGLITAQAKTQTPATVTAVYRSESGKEYVCKVQVSVILPEVTTSFTASAELQADGAGEDISVDLTSSGIAPATLVSVTDVSHGALIEFSVSGNVVSLKRSDLYSGINTYAFETKEAVYYLTLKTVTRYLRTFDDLSKLETYCLTDKETYRTIFTLNNETANGYSYGGYFELLSDIDCEGKTLPDWGGKAQFGNNGAAENAEVFGFQGTFEGNGHKISNFMVDGGERYFSGLFGTIGKNGVVCNLALEGAGVGYCGGALAGILAGTLKNVSVSGTFKRQNFAANWMYSGLCAARVTSTANVRNLFTYVTSDENTALNTSSAFGAIDDGAVFENVVAIGLETGYVTGQRYGQPTKHSGAGIDAYPTLAALQEAGLSYSGWDGIWNVSGNYPVLVPLA